MRDAIPAKIVFDPADLAALRAPGTSPQSSELLERVAKLLEIVEQRIANDSRILLDQNEAAKIMSCSAKSLQNWNVPFLKLGSRRVYRRETLEQFARERESTGEPAEVAR